MNRHYCEYCNVWMANDRQSIMLHENGKKHCLNVEKFLEEKRKNKLAQSKEAKLLQKSLQTMQQVAFEQHIRQDLHHNYYQDEEQTATKATTASAAINETADNSYKSGSVDKDGQKKKREWEQKKKQREAENKKRKTSQGDEESLQKKPKKRRLGPNEGHYSVDDKTYLEGKCVSCLFYNESAAVRTTKSHTRIFSFECCRHHVWGSAGRRHGGTDMGWFLHGNHGGEAITILPSHVATGFGGAGGATRNDDGTTRPDGTTRKNNTCRCGVSGKG